MGENVNVFHLGPGCMLFPFQVQVKRFEYLQEEWFVCLFFFFFFPFHLMAMKCLSSLIGILPSF